MSEHHPVSGCTHAVHFYDQTYPAEAAGDFIAAGLQAGDTCVVMLVGPHRLAVEQVLSRRGISTHAGGADPGTYLSIDTDEALAKLVVDGRLDAQRAAKAVAGLLRPPEHGGKVRLLGDPAPALFAAGRHEDAFALETLVDRLAHEHGAAVFCTYPLGAFCRQGHTRSLISVSAEHNILGFPDHLWAHGFLPRPGTGLTGLTGLAGLAGQAGPAASGRIQS